MRIIALVAVFQLALVSARVVQPWVDDYNASIASANFSTAGDVTVAAGPVCRIPYPAAEPGVWNKNKCRGEKFYDAMHSTKEQAGKLFKPVRDTSESPFTATSDLKKWGWMDAAIKPGYSDFKKIWGVDSVLRAIRVSDKATKDGGTIQMFRTTHGDGDANGGGYGETPYNKQPKYAANGKEYPVTGSEYNFAFDPSGMLLALDRKSPQFAGNERNPKVQEADLPELAAFSDIAWLKWKEATGNFPTTMHYFLTLAITNPETRSLLNIVLTRAEECEVPAWPGLEVDASSEEGYALLGMYQTVRLKTSRLSYGLQDIE
jgi:hypothetical protein